MCKQRRGVSDRREGRHLIASTCPTQTLTFSPTAMFWVTRAERAPTARWLAARACAAGLECDLTYKVSRVRVVRALFAPPRRQVVLTIKASMTDNERAPGPRLFFPSFPFRQHIQRTNTASPGIKPPGTRVPGPRNSFPSLSLLASSIQRTTHLLSQSARTRYDGAGRRQRRRGGARSRHGRRFLLPMIYACRKSPRKPGEA